MKLKLSLPSTINISRSCQNNSVVRKNCHRNEPVVSLVVGSIEIFRRMIDSGHLAPGSRIYVSCYKCWKFRVTRNDRLDRVGLRESPVKIGEILGFYNNIGSQYPPGRSPGSERFEYQAVKCNGIMVQS